MEPTSRDGRLSAWAGCAHTRWMWGFYYAIAMVWGVRSMKQYAPSALDYLVPLALAVDLAAWTIVDASLRGRPIPWWAQPWFVPFAGLLVPMYVIWTRRWRGLAWVIIHGAGWYAVAVMTACALGIFIFGERWWRALPW